MFDLELQHVLNSVIKSNLEDGHANRTTNCCTTSVAEGEVARVKLV